MNQLKFTKKKSINKLAHEISITDSVCIHSTKRLKFTETCHRISEIGISNEKETSRVIKFVKRLY